jgi:hypothetical protein
MSSTKKLNTDNFDELVDAIFELLNNVHLNLSFDMSKGFHLGRKKGSFDWNKLRERLYLVMTLLNYLKENNPNFPFERQSANQEESIIDAVLVAISRFKIFRNYSYDEALSIYNQRIEAGFPKMDFALLEADFGLQIKIS